MIFVEPELNSIIINEIDYKETRNYMPEFVLALRQLNPERTIHFVVDLKKAPVMFVIYFRKLKEATPTLPLELYFKDSSVLLQQVLKQYNLSYNDVSSYPYDLPEVNNVKEIIDPFEKVQGINDPERIQEIRDSRDNNDTWMPMTADTESEQKINKNTRTPNVIKE